MVLPLAREGSHLRLNLTIGMHDASHGILSAKKLVRENWFFKTEREYELFRQINFRPLHLDPSFSHLCQFMNATRLA